VFLSPPSGTLQDTTRPWGPAAAEDQQLWIRTLGPLEVEVGGSSAHPGGLKQRRALGLLALRANTPVPIRDLVAVIWDADTDIDDVLGPLHVYISHLRAILEPGRRKGSVGTRILRRGDGYQLRVGLEELDLLRFSDLVARARRATAEARFAAAASDLRAAESLWLGDPLPELADVLTVQPDLARLVELHLSAIEERADVELGLGRHVELAGELSVLTATYPLRERLHGQLMLALYRDGRQADALDVYRRLRATLRGELGVDPSTALQQLEHSILCQAPALIPSPLPAKPSSSVRHTVPSPPNLLIGRDREVVELTALLRSARDRLLTLYGPGGVGKTRLALAAAAAAGDARTAGACFVSLAGLSDPGLVPRAIADTLGLADVDGDPLAAVMAYLADRDLLLVLDNFEHLGDAAPLLGELVAAAPATSVLVTSRTVLRVCGETVYPLRPLQVDVDASRHAGDAHASAAVELFCARARAVRPDFHLTEDGVAVVKDICRRLDGLPLAIELAAARVRVLSPAAILRRLGSSLALLTGGPVDAPDRQRTLRATLTWSYDLLDDTERRLLLRLSVFRGGFHVEAAESVCNVENCSPDLVLETLDALVGHSLVQEIVDCEGELRFSLLETVREFAAERLGTAAQRSMRARHASYYAAGVRDASEELEARPATSSALRWLRTEQDNIRAALDWTLESDDVGTAQRLLVALEKHWEMSGAIGEGLDWSTRILSMPAGDDSAVRAQALNAAGTLAWYSGQYVQARRWHAAALQLQEAQGDLAGAAWSLNCLAVQDQCEQRWAAAERLLQRALVLGRQAGAERVEGAALQNLACQRWIEGDQRAAEELTEQSLSIARRIGDEGVVAGLLTNLGEIVAKRGDLRRGAELTQQGLQLAHCVGELHRFSCAILTFAEILLEVNQAGGTMRLVGAIDALRDQTGLRHHDTSDSDRINRLRSTATAALGPTTAAAAWAEGLRLTSEGALREVLANQLHLVEESTA
jgi:predicted ATPase/DNA-binding SARP family transcriptional activator